MQIPGVVCDGINFAGNTSFRNVFEHPNNADFCDTENSATGDSFHKRNSSKSTGIIQVSNSSFLDAVTTK